MNERVQWQEVMETPGDGAKAPGEDALTLTGTRAERRERRVRRLAIVALAASNLAAVVLLLAAAFGDDAWASRSPLLHVLGCGASCVGLLLCAVGGAVWWCVTGDGAPWRWAVEMLPWGVEGPVRSLAGICASVLALALVLRWSSSRPRRPGEPASRGMKAARVVSWLLLSVTACWLVWCGMGGLRGENGSPHGTGTAGKDDSSLTRFSIAIGRPSRTRPVDGRRLRPCCFEGAQAIGNGGVRWAACLPRTST